MPRTSLSRTLCLATLGACLGLAGTADSLAQGSRGHHSQGLVRQDRSSDDRHSEQRQADQSITAREAAEQARARFGGRVLKVDAAGRGYRVRLLQDDGRVIEAYIGG
ncbi:MAG: hypothetical protein ACK5HY_10270 [Parahaliea sp.]